MMIGTGEGLWFWRKREKPVAAPVEVTARLKLGRPRKAEA
jgi:hypothetical protein